VLFTFHLFAAHAQAEISIAGYFNDLYNRFSASYIPKRKPTYEKFSRDLGLNAEDELNQELFYKLYFLHDLFTGSYCINFVSGGVLRIPYAWHWVEPNPRHSITYLPDAAPLVKVRPPKEFSQYKSFADIDRVPSLYIKDLFSEGPKYYHPAAGDFYSFGWCSEREMAYAALMSVFGYQCKIKQNGIHVRTEVWLQLTSKNSNKINVILKIDNSVDIVEWEKPAKNSSLNDWKKDFGNGAQVGWYNKIAMSLKEKQMLTQTLVAKNQTNWIEENLSEWLDDFVSDILPDK